jgi:hypothetical protein
MAVVATDPYVVLKNGIDVSKAELQALLAEINTRLGGIPLAPANVDVGTMLVYGDDGRGPAPTTDGSRPILCSGRQLGFFKPLPVEIDDSDSITDSKHLGCLLQKKTTSAAVLTLNLHPDPTIGVSNNFACTILHYFGAGDLQIVSGMTNQHPASHTRVSEGGMATLYVDSDVGWWIKGETEA